MAPGTCRHDGGESGRHVAFHGWSLAPTVPSSDRGGTSNAPRLGRNRGGSFRCGSGKTRSRNTSLRLALRTRRHSPSPAERRFRPDLPVSRGWGGNLCRSTSKKAVPRTTGKGRDLGTSGERASPAAEFSRRRTLPGNHLVFPPGSGTCSGKLKGHGRHRFLTPPTSSNFESATAFGNTTAARLSIDRCQFSPLLNT